MRNFIAMIEASESSNSAYENSLAAIDARVRRRLDEISSGLGRPLRVLHIGNIANNAYVNAKIMRRYGVEADALVLDYYHIMGCPEWEEGVIEKLEGTQSDPDWYLTKVGDFSRPRWFLQGPASICSGYLNAKAANQPVFAYYYQTLLDWNLKCRGADAGPRRALYRRAWSVAHAIPALKWQIRNYIYLAGYHTRRLVNLVKYRAKLFLYYARYYAVRAVMAAIQLVRRAVWKTVRISYSVLPSILWIAARTVYRHLPVPVRDRLRVIVLGRTSVACTPATTAEAVTVHGSSDVASMKQSAAILPLRAEPSADPPIVPSIIKPEPLILAARVVVEPAAGARIWPKVDPPTAGDIAAYSVTAEKFRKAFDYYDVVQGYAVDGLYPLLAGKSNGYACYEHGTLRDIPYQPNAQGRMCAHAYQNAPAVFITNTDCVASAENLGIGPERRFPIPHAFDSDRVLKFRSANLATSKPHNQPVTFISPARHHWKHGEFVSWLKGNDVPIRAARLMADKGLDFKIIFVRWGQEIRESEALIKELGVEKHFEWIDPVPKQRLWQYYMSCNGVLDQFVIPAIGGVSFETLAFGRPLFTRIDEPVFKEFFGEVPPLLNVHTPEGLADAMAKVIRDPDCYDGIAEAALVWTAKYHSSQRIMEIMLKGYDRILKPAEASEATKELRSVAAPSFSVVLGRA